MTMHGERLYVRIVDPEHPHYPETGYLTGKVLTPRWGGDPMAEMTLDSCRHGTDACFVSKGQVEGLQPAVSPETTK